MNREMTSTEKAQAFAEDVAKCGKLTGKRARERGWHPATIGAAVRRGLVKHETHSFGLNAYDLYTPIRNDNYGGPR